MVKTLVHHLGLGDHIMLNGMVRHFAEREHVNIIVKRSHEESVRFMYRDIHDSVTLVLVDTSDPQEVWTKATQAGGDIIPLATYAMHEDNWTFMTEGPGSTMTNWAHSVYIQAGVNPSYMYTKFRVDRDRLKEFTLDHDAYVFVHDHPHKGQCVDVDTDLHVYRPGDERSNIFDYLSVIENAKAFHGVNSAYAWVVELTRIRSHETTFFHQRVAYEAYVPKIVQTVFSREVWTFV